MSDFEFEQVYRKRSARRIMESASMASTKNYVDKKGIDKSPNAAGLMKHFNRLVKETLGYGCDDIDRIKDSFLCIAVTNCRTKAVMIYARFIESWDGTQSHYDEMKAQLWSIPRIELSAFEELNGVMK